jgi:hypothetical protein
LLPEHSHLISMKSSLCLGYEIICHIAQIIILLCNSILSDFASVLKGTVSSSIRYQPLTDCKLDSHEFVVCFL